MKKRIFKNWKSSLIGLLIGASATAVLVTGKASLTEYSLFAPVWLSLIFSKDSFFSKK